jgi:hypothetical protein
LFSDTHSERLNIRFSGSIVWPNWLPGLPLWKSSWKVAISHHDPLAESRINNQPCHSQYEITRMGRFPWTSIPASLTLVLAATYWIASLPCYCFHHCWTSSLDFPRTILSFSRTSLQPDSTSLLLLVAVLLMFSFFSVLFPRTRSRTTYAQ